MGVSAKFHLDYVMGALARVGLGVGSGSEWNVARRFPVDWALAPIIKERIGNLTLALDASKVDLHFVGQLVAEDGLHLLPACQLHWARLLHPLLYKGLSSMLEQHEQEGAILRQELQISPSVTRARQRTGNLSWKW
jgi:hypothetical protein